MSLLFFFNDTATTEIYTLSLHDALPIYTTMNIPLVDLGAQYESIKREVDSAIAAVIKDTAFVGGPFVKNRSEEHTSELQSRQYLVCRLLLEKKKEEHENSEIAMKRSCGK